MDLLERTNLRADTYQTLAQCYYSPDQELLDTLGEPGGAGAGLEQIARAAAGANLAELLVDHARLFIGPYKLLAPPYGSVWLEDGILMGNSTMDVEDFYRREEVEATSRDVADHITAELEFMCVLIAKESNAAGAGDRDAADDYRKTQKKFLGLHLGAWIAGFADSVRQHAETEFYRTLARLTAEFVARDAEQLSTGRDCN